MEGIKDIKKLAEYILKRSYSKKEDIELLINKAEYSILGATLYMDGYIDALSYILSMIDPDTNFEEYIEAIIGGEVTSVDQIKVGSIVASKLGIITPPGNLSIVINAARINENQFDLSITPLVPFTDLSWRFERKYKFGPSPVDLDIYKNVIYFLDLGKIHHITIDSNNSDQLLKSFSIIGRIEDPYIGLIINKFNQYNAEMAKKYDDIGKELGVTE